MSSEAISTNATEVWFRDQYCSMICLFLVHNKVSIANENFWKLL